MLILICFGATVEEHLSSLFSVFPDCLRKPRCKQPHLRHSMKHLSCFGFSLRCWFSFCMRHLAALRQENIPRLFKLLCRVAIRNWVHLNRLSSPPRNIGLTFQDSKSGSQIQERLTLPVQLFLNPRGYFCIWYHLCNFSLQGPLCAPTHPPHPSHPIASAQWHMGCSTQLWICQQFKDVDIE